MILQNLILIPAGCVAVFDNGLRIFGETRDICLVNIGEVYPDVEVRNNVQTIRQRGSLRLDG